MMKKAIVVVAIVALAGVGSATVLKQFTVWEHGNDAQLVWSADKAYLFIGMERTGRSENYVQAFMQVVLDYFRLAGRVSERRFRLVAFTITPDRIERHVVDNVRGPEYRFLEGQIYTWDKSLLMWSGTGFEAATDEERRRFEAAQAARPSKFPGLEFTNVDGWSSRCCVLSRTYEGETRFPIEVNGQALVLVVTADGPHRLTTVDLQRPGRPTQRVWAVDANARRVNASEYEAFLNQK